MRVVGALLGVLLAMDVAGAGVHVKNVRTWPAPDHTRIVFDLDGAVEHTLFVLKNPQRVVVDMRGAEMDVPGAEPGDGDRFLSRLRHAPRNRKDLRIVLDLKRAVRPKSFLLKPSRNYGHRLVIDLYAGEERGGAPRVARSARRDAPRLRDVVVAIDPGHGGEDPGAMGPGGTREKDVVFAIAKHLESLMKRKRGMRPVMIRSGDYYVGLRKRTKLARKYRADLFISIHADAFKDRRVYGSSVYTLSRNGASSEAAKWLAASENAADLVGGVSLDDKEDLLASVLLDLSQTATLGASSDVAARVLSELKKLGKTHKVRPQRGGFVVLKSPDIPSVLVETAFISNPSEERKLRNTRHQRRVAQAILTGIEEYFQRSPPPGTLLATQRHVIEEGDTLSGIAQRYRVSLSRLRSVNSLGTDRLRVGDVLRIPMTRGG